MPSPTTPGLPIVAHDNRLVVIDKPAGITSEDAGRQLGRRLVHRIDRATSGLLLLADDARTVQRMQRLLTRAQVARTYLALVRGSLTASVIDRAIIADRGDGRRGSVERGAALPAKPARTIVDVVVALPHASLVVAQLVTGRTHQVRIHLADTGHPIFGDAVYGPPNPRAVVDDGGDASVLAPRLMLHAWRLTFVHPNTHAAVAFEAPPPPLFAAFVERIVGLVPPLPMGHAPG